MSLSKDKVLDKLRRVKGPDLDGNIVELGLVSEILIRDDKVYFSITVPPARATELEPMRQAAETVVNELPGIAGVAAVLTADAPQGGASAMATGASQAGPPEHARVAAARARQGSNGSQPQQAAPQQQPGPQTQAVAGVKHIIAVASGKGGVGKSTTAVNLALGFQAMGLKAGVLDADIYGPSQPRLLGLSGQPEVGAGNKLQPMQAYGLKVMSMGFLVEEGTPVIWRGPMVVSALNQMLREVAWSDGDNELDILVVDMPPGTGDVQLTMAQQVPLSGAVIVSTPQDLALIDARKGLAMFRKVDIPVLGIIENMSYFLCPSCGERAEIFGHGGAEIEAKKLDVPFLGGIPLHMDIRAKSDAGQPIAATDPDGPHAQLFCDIAARTWAEMEEAQGQRTPAPKLTVSDDKSALDVKFEDGARYELSAEMLRVMSPSAEVQGHSPEQRVTVGGKRNVKINELHPIGNYAAKIVFDDGHSTGIYTWHYLDLLGREKDQRLSAYVAELEAKGLSRD